MAERINIKKQVRFEVFKRDKFTCQYCGRKAPDVVLNIDHIDPVSKGGDNNIINLITSCFDCNNGKRDRALSDNSVVEKQRKQLELLQERREQIELMLEWKKSLASFDNDIMEMLEEYVNSKINPFVLNEIGKNTLSQLVKKYPTDRILDGIDETASKYLQYNQEGVEHDSVELFMEKIGAIIHLKGMPHVDQKLAYVKGIGRNRFSFWDNQAASIVLNTYVTACRNYGWDDTRILNDLEKEVIPLTKEAKNWSGWKNSLESWTKDINQWTKEEENSKEPDYTNEGLPSNEESCEFCSSDEPLRLVCLNPIPEGQEYHANICTRCLQSERTHRKDSEESLLEQLRIIKFDYDAVSTISEGFEEMKNFHAPPVMASIIAWALSDDLIMGDLHDKYFEHLRKNRNSDDSNIDDLPF